MEYEHEAQVVNFISGLLIGAVIGAGVALLTAPQPGRRTRRHIKRGAVELRETASDRWEDLADEVKEKVDETLQGAKRKFAR